MLRSGNSLTGDEICIRSGPAEEMLTRFVVCAHCVVVDVKVPSLPRDRTDG